MYGKDIEEIESFSSLDLSELKSMDEVDIMMRFCAENFAGGGKSDEEDGGYVPQEEQIALFREVLAWSEKEGELS